MRAQPATRRRLSDRTLWLILAVAVLALVAAVGFALWINGSTPLHPVRVGTSPSG